MNDKKRLLAHILNKPVSYLFAHPNPGLTAEQQQKFSDLSQRLDNGEPFAYLTGEREFWSLSFKVTPDVLIPRPETELLIEFLSPQAQRVCHSRESGNPEDGAFLLDPRLREDDTKESEDDTKESEDKTKDRQKALAPVYASLNQPTAKSLSENGDKTKLLDLGTGSGAIAISLKSENPNWHITATDFSEKALKVAQENANRLLTGKPNQTNPIEFIHSDWFKSIPAQKFDIIVSNPPYIEETDPHLQNEIRFEPLSALTSGTDGLDDIRKIINQSRDYLNNNGLLVMEHGYNQAPEVRKLLSTHGYTKIESLKDLAGIERATFGWMPNSTLVV